MDFCNGGIFQFPQLFLFIQISLNHFIIIFPNPSNGIVNLQINNPSNLSIQIKIFDNLGRIIRDSEIIEGEANWQQEMDIKEKGIYTVAIQIGNEIVYKRIIIAD